LPSGTAHPLAAPMRRWVQYSRSGSCVQYARLT
jgi:hypothetical protein